MGNRLRIGLLVTECYDEFTNETCQGAMRAAEELDVNLYILYGGYLKSCYNDTNKNAFDYQNNKMFEFAKDSNLDALVISLGTICGNVDEEEKRAFLDGFGDIPIITLASKEEGYSSILFDNKSGFARGVEYLIKGQRRTHIGIVSGPATNADANERLDAYKEVLAKNGLPILEDRIVYGNFSEYSEDVVGELLDKNPELDAIVFANDSMARGAYRELEKRGLEVGTDIAIVGFDDADYAALMNPGLTTTRADSQELGYQSMVRAVELAKTPKEERTVSDYRVDTTLVIRDSCGGIGGNDEADGVVDPTTIPVDRLAEVIFNNVFDFGQNISSVKFLTDEIAKLITFCNENIYKKELDSTTRREGRHFFKATIEEMMSYIKGTALFYQLVTTVLDLYYPYVESERAALKIRELKADIFQNIHVSVERILDNADRANNVLNWIMMDITRDLISKTDDETKYIPLLKKMSMLNYKSSLILKFPEIMHHSMGAEWSKPEKLYNIVYQNGTDCRLPQEEHALMDTATVFSHEIGANSGRKTYAACMLFSNTEQYGILVVEPTKENLTFIEPIRFQISSAFQMLSLISDKEKLYDQLEDNLEELREMNAFLDEVSKSDELTQIYNRRGFLVTVKKLIKQPENLGKRGLFIYADMNNLKLVNDKFGHEEGDYSLKSIAEILKKTLGKTSIVGRMGGDEFAAFLLLDEGVENREKLSTKEGLREVIVQNTEELNAGNDKPYYVSLSAGVNYADLVEDSDFDKIMAIADEDLYGQKAIKRKSIMK